MTTALATTDFSRDQIDTIKKTVARGASDTDLALFLEFCKARRLDPFTRQVYWTPKGIITSIDGFRAKAEETGAYVPGPTRYEYDADGKLVAAHVTVRKLVAGTWFDLEESAYLEEYKANTPTWTKLSRVMLSKCAEARAIRRAFPMIVSGMYEMAELEQAGVDPLAYQPQPVTPVARVTVMPVEKPAPVAVKAEPEFVGSGEFVAARNAIAECQTLGGLKMIAKSISSIKDSLLDGEADALRAAYNDKRKTLEA